MPNFRGKTAKPRATAVATDASDDAPVASRAKAPSASQGRAKKAATPQTTSVSVKATAPAAAKGAKVFSKTKWASGLSAPPPAEKLRGSSGRAKPDALDRWVNAPPSEAESVTPAGSLAKKEPRGKPAPDKPPVAAGAAEGCGVPDRRKARGEKNRPARRSGRLQRRPPASLPPRRRLSFRLRRRQGRDVAPAVPNLPAAATQAKVSRLPTLLRPAPPSASAATIRFPTSRRSPTTSPMRSSTPARSMAAYHAAARDRRDQVDDRRRYRRNGPLARPRRRILHVRSQAGVRGADGADHPVRQPVGRDAPALPGHAGCGRSPNPTAPTSASRMRSGATIRSSIFSSRPMC